MKKYYLYRLKTTFLRPVIFLVISILYILYDMSYDYKVDYSGMYTVTVIISFSATLLPIFELYQFKSKKNLDTFFSVPLSRGKMALCHFLCGLTQLSIVYTMSYVFLFVHRLILSESVVMIYFLPHYFARLILGALLYCLFCFIFYQANTMIDGILFEFLYIFAPGMLWSLICDVIYEISGRNYSKGLLNLSTYAPIDCVTTAFQKLAEPNRYNALYVEKMLLPLTLIFVVISVAALFGFFRTFVKTRVENAENISDSPFGYKVLIPICGIYLAPAMPILNIILVAIGYVIYRRGFKFKRSDYIVMASVLAVSILSEIL